MLQHEVDQNTLEWHALRAGMPTASCASQLVTPTGLESKSMTPYAYKLAGEMYDESPGDGWQGNQSTQFGHDEEHSAATAYAMVSDLEVTKVGFITDDLLRYGCSPDRFVGDVGLLEIKCLPEQHMKAIMHVYHNNAPPPEYSMQPQMQLLVTKREWVDLYFYSPKYPSNQIRIYPNPALQAVLKTQIQECIRIRNETFKIMENM